MRLIGGGSRSPLWRQILADCFQLPVEMLSLTSEATSWGAAVAGGVGAGVYGWEIAAERSRVVETVEPIPANVADVRRDCGVQLPRSTGRWSPIYTPPGPLAGRAQHLDAGRKQTCVLTPTWDQTSPFDLRLSKMRLHWRASCMHSTISTV